MQLMFGNWHEAGMSLAMVLRTGRGEPFTEDFTSLPRSLPVIVFVALLWFS